MIIIKLWKYDGIPASIALEGVSFIRQRFYEEWGVRRSDVTVESLKDRVNFVAFDRDNIVGWLGVTKDKELVNGCVERSLNGVYLLRRIIGEALIEVGLPVHAFIPISKLGSAAACILTGQKCIIDNSISRKKYDSRVILLKRLTILEEKVSATDREKLALLSAISGEGL